jgi:hypothetical protein
MGSLDGFALFLALCGALQWTWFDLRAAVLTTKSGR